MRVLKDHKSRKRHADGHLGSYMAYMCNRYGCGGKAACSSHYINCNTLTKLMLLDIRAKEMLAQNSPVALKEKILAQKNAASLEQTKTLRATLAAVDKRLDRSQWTVVEGTHEPIIPRPQWDRVQALLKQDTRSPDFEQNLSPFAGSLRCGDCGRAMCKTKHQAYGSASVCLCCYCLA